MTTLIKLDKKFTPFLIKAINALMNSKFITLGTCDVANFHMLFEDVVHKKNEKEYYTISFYVKEITQENWMDMAAGDAGGINIDIDVKTQEVISIYSDR